MTPKEQTRLQVLNSLMAEHMTLDQAATLMGVSARHTRRILAACREKGAASVAHGHRGRRAPNATPEAVAYDVVHLARTRYSGANHTHLSELLSEREGIDIGRTTLRRILVNAGLKLDFTQNPGKVMDDITFVRSHWWLVSEGFSLSTANSDVQKLPATLYHRIADSLAYAA